MIKKAIQNRKIKSLHKNPHFQSEELKSIQRSIMRYPLENLAELTSLSKEQLFDIAKGDVIPNSIEKASLKRAIGTLAHDKKHSNKTIK